MLQSLRRRTASLRENARGYLSNWLMLEKKMFLISITSLLLTAFLLTILFKQKPKR